MREFNAAMLRSPGLRALAWCLAAALAVLPAIPAAAQEDSVGTGVGHGWAVVRTGPDRRPGVIHFPPRSGHNAAPRGTVRFAAWLNDDPAWLTSWGNDVYLLFAPRREASAPQPLDPVSSPAPADRAPSEGQPGSPAGPQQPPSEAITGSSALARPAVMLSAVPLVAGLWENHPAGRFRTLPVLEGEGDVVGFVGSDVGPVALLRVGPGGEPPAELRLLVLSGKDWVQLEHPVTGLAAGDRVRLVSMPDGPALVVERASGISGSLWTATLLEPRRGEVSARWNEQAIELEGGDRGTFLGLDGQLLRYRHIEGEGLVLELIRPGSGAGVYEVARYADVPPDASIVPLVGAGTLVVMWTTPEGEKAGHAYELREISAFSGRVWYAGTGGSGGLVATRQFQILAVGLVVVMATVMLFILRPGDQSASLPTGMMAAEPSRRIAAGGADFLLGVLLSSFLTGIDGSEMLSPVVLLGSKPAAGALLLAFWLTFAHTAAGEWFFGRSLGKAMAGCEVVRVQRVPLKAPPADDGIPEAEPKPGPTVVHVATLDRPLLWQSLARNAVRWGLPPLALWVLADPSSRHPGDLLARTMVVVRNPQVAQETSGSSPNDKGDRGEG